MTRLVRNLARSTHTEETAEMSRHRNIRNLNLDDELDSYDDDDDYYYDEGGDYDEGLFCFPSVCSRTTTTD